MFTPHHSNKHLTGDKEEFISKLFIVLNIFLIQYLHFTIRSFTNFCKLKRKLIIISKRKNKKSINYFLLAFTTINFELNMCIPRRDWDHVSSFKLKCNLFQSDEILMLFLYCFLSFPCFHIKCTVYMKSALVNLLCIFVLPIYCLFYY